MPRNFWMILFLFGNVLTAQRILLTKIDVQYWAKENLKIKHFKNGDPIPYVATKEDWVTAFEQGRPAFCYYNNDSTFGEQFGYIYNWFALADPRGLAPEGSRVANQYDWDTLFMFINSRLDPKTGVEPNNTAMKSLTSDRLRSTQGWSNARESFNMFNFNVLSGGYRLSDGTFSGKGSVTGIWVRDTDSYGKTSKSWASTSPYLLFRGDSPDAMELTENKRNGFYVRVIAGIEFLPEMVPSNAFESDDLKIMRNNQNNKAGNKTRNRN
ncbi:MAG: FISUMP domain-containing protein [Crocinitomicaceae bacterium]